MEYRFVLHVEYGTGSLNMLTNNPSFLGAIKDFLDEYGKQIPDTKMYGLPEIRKAELMPLMHTSIYSKERNAK